MRHLDFWQEPHNGPGCCKAQACEEVGTLPGRQQGRQVLLCPGGSSDESPSALVNLCTRQCRLTFNRHSPVTICNDIDGTHKANLPFQGVW